MKCDKRLWGKSNQNSSQSRVPGWLFFFVFALLIFCATGALSKEITLSWTRNLDPVDGYKVYSRLPNESYDYQNPIMNVPIADCSSDGCVASVSLPDNADVYFVVRAYLKSGVGKSGFQ